MQNQPVSFARTKNVYYVFTCFVDFSRDTIGVKQSPCIFSWELVLSLKISRMKEFSSVYLPLYILVLLTACILQLMLQRTNKVESSAGFSFVK